MTASILVDGSTVPGVVLIDPATGNAYSASGGGSTVDRELVVTTYRAKNAFTGASIGDTITATQIIDVSGAPTTVSTVWRNQTTALDLAGAPSAADLELTGSNALTDAQLRATPLALPTGAATSALQTTGNASLSNIDVDLGAQADATATTDTGTFSLIAFIKRGLTNWTTLLSRVPTLGQKTAAGSMPVVLATDQPTLQTQDAPLVETTYNQTGVIAINTDLFVVDCLNYRSLSIQAISVGTSGSITPAWSNDGVNFIGASFVTPTGSVNSAISGPNLWTVTVSARYLRFRMTTATTGGTTTLSVQGFSGQVGQPVLQPIGGSVSASITAGSSAHSTVAIGAPVRVGGRVNTAVDTTLVAGDASDLFVTTGGQALIKPYGMPETDWRYTAASGGIINTSDVVLQTAGAAGVRNYLTDLTVVNASATVSTEVVVKDGATIIWRGFVGNQTLPNSTWAVNFQTPLRGTAATALNAACITTGAAVYINAQGYQAI